VHRQPPPPHRYQQQRNPDQPETTNPVPVHLPIHMPAATSVPLAQQHSASRQDFEEEALSATADGFSFPHGTPSQFAPPRSNIADEHAMGQGTNLEPPGGTTAAFHSPAPALPPARAAAHAPRTPSRARAATSATPRSPRPPPQAAAGSSSSGGAVNSPRAHRRGSGLGPQHPSAGAGLARRAVASRSSPRPPTAALSAGDVVQDAAARKAAIKAFLVARDSSSA
jgi:hypothetical protein